MPSLAEIVRLHGNAYLERFRQAVPRRHRQVLASIAACRTGELGTAVYACSRCGRKHRIGRSCGNRHCSTCQQEKTKGTSAKVSVLSSRGGTQQTLYCRRR
jgi:PHP family Zn ribbon phosphoesterase